MGMRRPGLGVRLPRTQPEHLPQQAAVAGGPSLAGDIPGLPADAVAGLLARAPAGRGRGGAAVSGQIWPTSSCGGWVCRCSFLGRCAPPAWPASLSRWLGAGQQRPAGFTAAGGCYSAVECGGCGGPGGRAGGFGLAVDAPLWVPWLACVCPRTVWVKTLPSFSGPAAVVSSAPSPFLKASSKSMCVGSRLWSKDLLGCFYQHCWRVSMSMSFLKATLGHFCSNLLLLSPELTLQAPHHNGLSSLLGVATVVLPLSLLGRILCR